MLFREICVGFKAHIFFGKEMTHTLTNSACPIPTKRYGYSKN
jgi:hypothetical protein